MTSYLCTRFNRQVAREDQDFCRWTHEGLRSLSYRGGPLSELEVCLGSFQERIRELIPVARRGEAPAPTRVAEENQRAQATP